MDTTVKLIANRMDGLKETLSHIAHNMSNADTPGFKRLVSKYESSFAIAPTSGSGGAGYASLLWPVPSGAVLDLSQGKLRMTGRPLDLAIRGEGFFVLDTVYGPRYTRKGRIYLNSEGELCDSENNRFTGASGSLRVPPEATEVIVDKEGQIMADGELIGKLAVVRIPGQRNLVPEGMGLLRNDGEQVEPATDVEILQGAIEMSNVNPVQEMVELMAVTRAYEAASRALRQIDGLKKLLLKLA